MQCRDFIGEIINRIPHSWYDGLVEHVEYLYMTSRDKGAFPVFHELTKDQHKERDYLHVMSERRRSANISKVMEETADREARRHLAYDNISEIRHRSHQVEALIAEQRINEKVTRKAALESLYYNVKMTEQKLNERRDRKLYHEALVSKGEHKRLLAVIKQDDRIQAEKKERERERELHGLGQYHA
jgi:hypothetical protein